MCASVRRAARSITQIYDAFLAPSGIGIAQFDLLAQIRVAEEASRTELADVMAMDRTTLVRNLAVLERDGLIETRPGGDRRMRPVGLTEAGLATLSRALPLWQAAQSSVRSELGQERWQATRERLAEIEALPRP